jgi:hypothetical protein
VYQFPDGADVQLDSFIKVPDSYQTGTPIIMVLGLYSPSASGTMKMKSTTYLIRNNIDAVSSVANSYASTNTALTNTVADRARKTNLDLTNSVGAINSIVVQPGDLLHVVLTRDYANDTDTDAVRVMSLNGVTFNVGIGEQNFVIASGSSGHGSTSTKIRRFTTASVFGGAITHASSAALGDTFTINEDGVYGISYSDNANIAGAWLGISKNSVTLTTSVFSLSPGTEQLAATSFSDADFGETVAVAVSLEAGDVIRAHTNGFTFGLVTPVCYFSIAKISN